jgi:hypothetical protein
MTFGSSFAHILLLLWQNQIAEGIRPMAELTLRMTETIHPLATTLLFEPGSGTPSKRTVLFSL